jgi:hypothetical protein
MTRLRHRASEIEHSHRYRVASAARAKPNDLDLPGTQRVVLSCGAFIACPNLAQRIDALPDDFPEVEVTLFHVEPAMGAVTLAMELLQ